MCTAQGNYKYQHILITNDDGIEDADRLLALARSVKRVSVVVSSFDRSGTSNYTTYGKHQSTLEVTCKYFDQESNISVYEMPGNPADCVLLGLNGLFHNDRPDLVLSGINGGANIGPGWFRSGTVGAIRTASMLGVRGIALSGFNDEDQRSFTAIPDWVTQLISSKVMDEMDRNSYLTIGFPKALEEIKGIKVAPREVSYTQPEFIAFQKIHGDASDIPENTTIWTLKNGERSNTRASKSDQDFLNEGYIVITPMSIDENNPKLLKTFQKRANHIPEFAIDN